MNIFDQYESNVRSYCRKFTDTYKSAKGSVITSEDGKEFLDFFAGAGALNYGHSNDAVVGPVIEYLQSGGIIHALDMHTSAKAEFIKTFQEKILKPKNLDYKIMFCGPTGTNAVEAALKLARKNTGRSHVFAFSGGFHGMTQGSMSVTSNDAIRGSAGVALCNTTYLPYPSRQYEGFDTIKYIETLLTDDHSGVDKPAAMILETVQAEGGINVAPAEWLKQLRELCDKHGILMICDDIQIGCYRTGDFFSFERAGIVPDMVVLSKSISGGGFPMSLLLMKPELDIYTPGEHNGTFRGYQPGFVGAKAAVEYSIEADIANQVKSKHKLIMDLLSEIDNDERTQIRGLGMIIGIDFNDWGIDGMARSISALCYEQGLIIETAGRNGNVLKLLPPLTTTEEQLKKGCEIICNSVKKFISQL